MPNLETHCLERLNTDCQALPPFSRLPFLYEEIGTDNLLITTSFGAWSGVLLAVLCENIQTPTVHFIDTGFHFDETLEYKRVLEGMLDIRIVEVSPEANQHEATKEQALWQTDPHRCCGINKVEPLNRLKSAYRIWVSGLMGWQTPHRGTLNVIRTMPDIARAYPLIDLSYEQALDVLKEKGIPRHPLAAQGYESIGCFPCTASGRNRTGRWSGFSKTECGLHL